MQTELFEFPTPKAILEERTAPKASFLEKKIFILRVDHLLAIFMLLSVFYVLVFSWGVENGKRQLAKSRIFRVPSEQVVETNTDVGGVLPQTVAASERATQVFQPAAKIMSSESVQVEIPREVPMTVSELPKPIAQVVRPEGQFTIQHVTYVTQKAAEAEIARLSKLGYQAFTIPSGKHYQVCIDAFQTKESAKEMLKNLRTKKIVSGDAYVRPMIRSS